MALLTHSCPTIALAATSAFCSFRSLRDGNGNAHGMADTDELAVSVFPPARSSLSLDANLVPMKGGDRFEVVVAHRVDLKSGSLAVVEKSRLFTLVPWRPVFDRQIGEAGSGIMRADGINWQFGRGHAGPEIS